MLTPPMFHMDNKGFTLIELSIVLVIIGLIVGGVLVGKDLIQSAEIRKTISQIEGLKTAVQAFQLKYDGLPGDMTNIGRFFAVANDCPNRKSIISPDDQTCDGDGNGQWAGEWPESTNQLGRYWVPQQLALAGLIAGKFTGTCYTGNAGDDCVGWPNNAGIENGKNSIATIIGGDNSAYEFSSLDIAVYKSGGGYDGYAWDSPQNRNVLIWGVKPQPDIIPVISSGIARDIDIKMDDGLPARGSVRTMRNSHLADFNLCNTTSTASNAVYTPDDGQPRCSMVFSIAP